MATIPHYIHNTDELLPWTTNLYHAGDLLSWQQHLVRVSSILIIHHSQSSYIAEVTF